jgi:succinoglycan biosynthesis transport protein ExoP
MTVVSDHSHRPLPRSAARAFARLNTAETHQVTPSAPAAVGGTVTLGKIGDFLELDLRRLFVWLRAGLVVALTLAALGAIGGGAYGILSKPLYTVTSDILIDPSQLQVVPNDLYANPGQVDGQLLNAGSKVRVLTSRNVLARVVADLDLAHDQEFYNPTPSFSLSSLFGSGSRGAAAVDPSVVALASLAAKIRVQADEKSFVATLIVSAESPEKAIRISDAIFKSFQNELATAEADGASRTASALNDRLNQLKNDVQAAEERVEAYKRDNNLLSTDTGSLVSTQTMTQLNGQVIEARAKVVAAQSAYDSLIAAGRNATTADTETSAMLTALRTNAGNLQQQLDSASRVYGPKHPTVVKLSAELSAVNAQLDAEVARIGKAAKATLDQAQASLVSLTAQSDKLRSGVFTDNDAMVTLRQLERDASSKSTIYEAFLARARQVAEQEQIDTSNVRVISTAVPPPGRSWPPPTAMLALLGALGGFALGLLGAVLVGALRDLRRPARLKPAAA